MGGLGVLDLKRMSWALRARWSWLQRVDPGKPWALFPIKVNRHINALIHAATSVKLGDGTKIYFWTDRWLAGQSISSLAPAVFAAVSARIANARTVAAGVHENSWIKDISGPLSVDGIMQFLHLVEIIDAQELSPDNADELSWNFTSSGSYSSKSAYSALFEGMTFSPHCKAIWDCWAPLKCKVFAWLAAADRCWTAERRMRHGLADDDTCAVCDQGSESITHLLLQCPFEKTYLV
jgi:hypothetical protein